MVLKENLAKFEMEQYLWNHRKVMHPHQTWNAMLYIVHLQQCCCITNTTLAFGSGFIRKYYFCICIYLFLNNLGMAVPSTICFKYQRMLSNSKQLISMIHWLAIIYSKTLRTRCGFRYWLCHEYYWNRVNFPSLVPILLSPFLACLLKLGCIFPKSFSLFCLIIWQL